MSKNEKQKKGWVVLTAPVGSFFEDVWRVVGKPTNKFTALDSMESLRLSDKDSYYIIEEVTK